VQKLKLAVIFGGMSTEHDVSIVSGMSILKNLDKENYNIYPIYINKEGMWFKYIPDSKEMENIKVGDKISNIEKIENPIEYLRQMEYVFPVLHGLYGEDGTIQGLLELIKVPYVGCKVLASSISMDKAYTKIIFEKAGLNQAKYVYIKEEQGKYIYIDSQFNETLNNEEEIIQTIEKQLKYPMFVKPSNSGSSVGISKVTSENELKEALKLASKYDKKILIEQGINGREVECAVLEVNGELKASCVGEVKSAEEFYSFDSKYKNQQSKTQIPANIEKEIAEEIKKQAKKAFRAVDGKDLSRVDFFIENETNKIIINEINTMPGFTDISMYPKLFEQEGISYKELLNRIFGTRPKIQIFGRVPEIWILVPDI